MGHVPIESDQRFYAQGGSEIEKVYWLTHDQRLCVYTFDRRGSGATACDLHDLSGMGAFTSLTHSYLHRNMVFSFQLAQKCCVFYHLEQKKEVKRVFGAECILFDKQSTATAKKCEPTMKDYGSSASIITHSDYGYDSSHPKS